MSHFLKTMNPEAAADLTAPDPVVPMLPLPGVGDSVVFYPRPGELRAGRGKHAAIVTATHDEDQTLDLVVVFDADDFIGQRRVPRRSLDGGMGWEVRATPTAELEARIDAVAAILDRLGTVIFGDLVMPEGDSVLGILSEIEDKVEAIAPTLSPAKPKPKARAKAKAKVAAKAKAEGK